jgi:FkbM family methyltransferase
MHITMPNSIKRLTNPVVGRIPIRIASGVNRGLRWSLAAAGSGYGSGKRESLQMQVIWNLMRDDDCVWDVGAHYGFVALAAARRAPGGHVHAFEPGHSNFWFLSRHVGWNRMPNIKLHNCAVGDMDGTTTFGGGATSKQHRLGGGDEVVRIQTIRTLIASGAAQPPTFMKIDVEGAENAILRNGLADLGRSTRMLIAVHSHTVYDDCVSLLRTAGFEFEHSERLKRYTSTGFHGDADLFTYGPDYDAARDLAELKRLGF